MKFVSQKFSTEPTKNRHLRETKIAIPRNKIRRLRISHKTHKKSRLFRNQRHYPTKWNSFLQFSHKTHKKSTLSTREIRYPTKRTSFPTTLPKDRQKRQFCEQRSSFRGILVFVCGERRTLLGFVGNLWKTNFILWGCDFGLWDVSISCGSCVRRILFPPTLWDK